MMVEIRNVELDEKVAELHTDVLPGPFVLLPSVIRAPNG